MTFWDRLAHVQALHFVARSSVSTGWNGEGGGHVQVQHHGNDVLIFSEQGTWTPRDAASLSFRNVFRWTHKPTQHIICLEHLRFGPENPVYLFDLYQQEDRLWGTCSPHVCNQDTYEATVRIETNYLTMQWDDTRPGKTGNLALYVYLN